LTLTETVTWCESVSLIVSVQVPPATDVTLSTPLTTEPVVTMPEQPLMVNAAVELESPTVRFCTTPAAANDNVVGVTDNCPGGGEAVGSGEAVGNGEAVGVGETLGVACATGTVFIGPPHAASAATNANATYARKRNRIMRRLSP
jgi:hypothetical protein